MKKEFDYSTAFKRTVGWVTEPELNRLRQTRVAIAGLGGVGGSHLLTLARLGIGSFSLSDYDQFELHNLNRQAGATMDSLGRSKLDVLQEQALAINPELSVATFPRGIDTDNVDAFLDGADVYVDGLDFFAFETRRHVFARAAALGIPAVTAAPLGMGVALLSFDPEGLSFDDYFDLRSGLSDEELAVRFMVGLAPARLHMHYLADPSAVDLAAQRGPSTPMACELCAGVIGTEVLKVVLNRGPIRWAPHGLHFDAYTQRMARTWRPGGNRNPLQRLMIRIALRRLATMRNAHQAAEAGR